MNTANSQNFHHWKRKSALFLISQNISIFGSSIVSYSIIFYIALETSSGVWMTMATICSMIPQMLVSLWGGVFADRHNRKWIIMLSDGGIAMATLALALLYFAGQKSMVLLLAVSAIRSLGSGLQNPAVNALYPQIVPSDQLARINGIGQTMNSVLVLLAPAVGGMLLARVGIAWAFLLDVGTATLAIGVLALLRVPPRRQTTARTSVLRELQTGVRFTLHHKLLRSVMLGIGISFFLMTPAACLTPIMVGRSFGPEVWKLTASETFWTLGSIVGGIVLALHGDFEDKIRTAALSLAGFGVTFGLLGLCKNFWVYLAIMGISGIFTPIISTAMMVLIQTHVEEAMMGRVFSILQIVMSGAMPLGMLLFGPLADLVSIEWILVVTGVLLVLCGVVFARVKDE